MSKRSSLEVEHSVAPRKSERGFSKGAKLKLVVAAVVILASTGWVIWTVTRKPEQFQIDGGTLEFRQSLNEVMRDPDFRAVDVVYGASGDSVRFIGAVPSAAALQRLKQKVSELNGTKAEYELSVVKP